MQKHIPFELLADSVLVVHCCIVVFVVGGLLLIVAGNMLGWRWVNRLWFRAVHLAAIGVVYAESLFGLACPLTTLESWLRSKAGMEGYAQSFIGHWLQQALFYDEPAWVFTVAYSLFGGLAILVWWYFPPVKEHYHADAR